MCIYIYIYKRIPIKFNHVIMISIRTQSTRPWWRPRVGRLVQFSSDGTSENWPYGHVHTQDVRTSDILCTMDLLGVISIKPCKLSDCPFIILGGSLESVGCTALGPCRRGGRAPLTEMPLLRIARQRTVSLISTRGSARKARIEKCDLE